MNTEFEILKIEELSFRKVNFYTIKNTEANSSELKLFLNKVSDYGFCEEDLKHISASIKQIGKKFGAKLNRFKKESKAFALPAFYPKDMEVKGRKDYGLRLYCIIISEDVVILLNGGLKVKTKAQECPNCSMHFHHANFLTKVIKDYIDSGGIEVRDKELIIKETLYY